MNALTLNQVNGYLAASGFPGMSHEAVSRLFAGADRTKLVSALESAQVNTRARKFLSARLVDLGLMPMQATPAEKQAHAPNVAPGSEAVPRPVADPNARPAQVANSAGQGGHTSARESRHVYAGTAALCFEADTTRKGVPTVLLDAALATAPKSYDWEHKIRIQMTEQELPCVLAVLLGYLPVCDYKNHGEEGNKGFSVERQTGKVFVRAFAAGEKLRAVPMTLGDTALVATLIMQQYRRAHPEMDGAMIDAVLMGIGRLLRPAVSKLGSAAA